jgi:small subunit ribosomal protein S7
MRRPIKNKRPTIADPVYGEQVARLVNYLMEGGKKETARGIVYRAFDKIKEEGQDPVEVFDMAIKNAGPLMEVRSRRVGGANYQVPREVRESRRVALAYRWIINAARNKKGKPMHEKLAEELVLAAKNEGDAVKKRDDVHRMAESNKAFAHFAW